MAGRAHARAFRLCSPYRPRKFNGFLFVNNFGSLGDAAVRVDIAYPYFDNNHNNQQTTPAAMPCKELLSFLVMGCVVAVVVVVVVVVDPPLSHIRATAVVGPESPGPIQQGPG